MDKPSWPMAMLAAAVAAVVFGGALGPRARAVDALPAPPAAVAPSGAEAGGCADRGAPRVALPAVVPPAGPADAQVNAAGTGAAGGAGTVPGDGRGDPCAPAKRFGETPGAAASAAALTTPATLNGR